MTQQTKNTRTIKYLTVMAVTVLIVLLLVAVTLIVQKVQLENRRNALKAQIEYYQSLSSEKEDQLHLRETYEWLEQQARELGMLGEGETLFGANE